MSMDRCSRCDRLVDTDFDLECYDKQDRCICESCRGNIEEIEKLIEDLDDDISIRNTKIVLHFRTSYSLKVFYENGSDLGEIEKLEDGYFVWFPRQDCGGAFTERILFDIANNLNFLNKEGLQWNR